MSFIFFVRVFSTDANSLKIQSFAKTLSKVIQTASEAANKFEKWKFSW